MEFLLTTMLQSLPEVYIKIYFAISLLKPSLVLSLKRMVIYSVIIAFSSQGLNQLINGFEIWFVLVFMLSIVLCKIIFNFSWVFTITLIICGYIMQWIGELSILFFVQIVYHLSLPEIQQNLFYKITLPYIYFIPVFFLSIILRRRRSEFQILNQLQNYKYKWLIPLILIQLIIGLMIQALYYLSNQSYNTFFVRFPVHTIAMILVTIVIFFYIEKIHKKDIEKNIEYAEKPLIVEMEKLIQQWRTYRHDFHNHIEVLYSLILEEEFIEAKKYMETIHEKVTEQQTKQIFKQPAVQALINAKVVQGENANIKFNFKCEEDFIFPQMKSYDVVVILGNLINNAIEALLSCSVEDKWIKVEYYKVFNVLVLNITNNGPIIPANEQSKIFDEGFTTKNTSNNKGTGLAGVRHVLTLYDGEITVKSDNVETTFQIAIPINNNN